MRRRAVWGQVARQIEWAELQSQLAAGPRFRQSAHHLPTPSYIIDRDRGLSMNVYYFRDKPAHNFKSDPNYCENPLILKWWSPVHDHLLSERISKEQWFWPWKITPKIVEITPVETIDSWVEEDLICAQYAWYNVLMYFAISRAEKLGLTTAIRKPEWKICPLCDQKFVEDSVPMTFAEKLGINQLDFCGPCLNETLENSGDNTLSKEEIGNYLRKLTDTMKRAPSQTFGSGMDDFRDLNTAERLALLRVLKKKPTVDRVKELFGSWRKALVDAGVRKDGARRTSQGTD
jgi:hypothetical protein